MIPKVIHYCWFSGEEKPQIIKECIQSWKNILRDYEIKEWTLENFDYSNIQFVSQAIHYKKWAFVADYFRLWVLYNYGGIYMDCDVVVNKTFDKVLNNTLFLGWEDLDLLEAHVIGSISHHNWLKNLLSIYGSVHIKNIYDFNEYIMPQVITKFTSSDYKLKRNFKKQVLTDDINIYPINIFTLNLNDNKNICDHLFLGSWSENSSFQYKENLILRNNDFFSSVIKRNIYFIKRFAKKILTNNINII